MIIISFALVLTLAGCGGDDNASAPASTAGGAPAAAAERRGTITVGEETWIIVFKACDVYPGPIVNIWGSAESDPALEITIDYGGPDQVVVGTGREALWHAKKDTLDVRVEGKNVRGSATFTENSGGSGMSAEGSFEVNCG